MTGRFRSGGLLRWVLRWHKGSTKGHGELVGVPSASDVVPA
jgi:hypothetical protein